MKNCMCYKSLSKKVKMISLISNDKNIENFVTLMLINMGNYKILSHTYCYHILSTVKALATPQQLTDWPLTDCLS